MPRPDEIPLEIYTNQPKSTTGKTNRLFRVGSILSQKNVWIPLYIAIVATTIIIAALIWTRNKTVGAITATRPAMPHEDYHSSFRIMTYNIRFDTPRDGINQWNLRKNRVASLIRYHRADIVGIQEALLNQIVDLKTILPSFDWYGVGRDDGQDKGEFSAIFYRKDRFEPLDNGTFWLSETPDIPGSKGWDADVTRICSWLKLRDRWTLQTFYHFNTHFDNIGEIARRESARLIVARMQNITKHDTPVILTGDLNTGPNADPYRMIITNSALQDAKSLTEIPHYGPNGTWSTFFFGQPLGDRLDYVFVTPDYLRTLQHAIITDSDNRYYPSDHLPVLAELAMDNATHLN